MFKEYVPFYEFTYNNYNWKKWGWRILTFSLVERVIIYRIIIVKGGTEKSDFLMSF